MIKIGTNYYFEVNSSKSDQILTNIQNNLFLSKESYDIIEKEFKWIHICKFSCNWKPLFEKTKYYSNKKELIDFYKRNLDLLKIKDENNNYIDLQDLLDKIANYKWEYSYDLLSSDSVKSFNECKYLYYTDEYGFDWCVNEFS